MVFEYQRQPYKALYLTYEVLLTVLLRIPYWVVRYSFRGLRPLPVWSFKRALMNAFIRQFNFVSTLCERFVFYFAVVALTSLTDLFFFSGWELYPRNPITTLSSLVLV